MSERTFRRWTRRYEEEGEAGLLGVDLDEILCVEEERQS